MGPRGERNYWAKEVSDGWGSSGGVKVTDMVFFWLICFFLTDIEFWKTISVKVKFDISQKLADWYRIGVDWYEGAAFKMDPISVKNHISQNLLTDIKKMSDW